MVGRTGHGNHGRRSSSPMNIYTRGTLHALPWTIRYYVSYALPTLQTITQQRYFVVEIGRRYHHLESLPRHSLPPHIHDFELTRTEENRWTICLSSIKKTKITYNCYYKKIPDISKERKIKIICGLQSH